MILDREYTLPVAHVDTELACAKVKHNIIIQHYMPYYMVYCFAVLT